MAARHFKYIYNSEIPPKTILSKMLKGNIDDNYINNNQSNKIDLNIARNKIYFNRRRELKSLMKSINSHIDNNSQSLFLTLYYMDVIFTHKDLEKVFFSHFYTWKTFGSYNDIQMNNYVLLSLACLILASKFNENDPHVPTMSSYIRLLFEYSKKKYIFNLDSLYMAEVVVIKLLAYKLNYYTIYHYLIFFFTHGIVLKETIENANNYKYTERKILEKIYIQSREILDGIIDSENYFDLYFGKDNYIIVIEIFLWCIEHILNIKLKDNENIFRLVFNLNIEEKKHKELYEIISEVYKNMKKKNSQGNKSTRIPINNSGSKTNNYSKESELSTIPSSSPQNLDINFKYIEPKSSVPISSAYKMKKNYYQNEPRAVIKTEKDKDFNYYNRLFNIEFEKKNSNLVYKLSYPYQYSNQSTKNDNLCGVPQSNIKYGPNNRIYLTSNKNVTSNYHINSAEKREPKIVNSINDIKISRFNIDNEPIDTDKNININMNYNNINNDSENIRKKSFSCSKKVYNYNMQYNYNYRPSTNINTSVLNKIKFEDDNQKAKISDKETNNYYYNFTQINNNQYKDNNKKNENENLYNKYHPTNKTNIYSSINGSYLRDKVQPKLNNNDELITKINPTLDIEPKDNNRRRSTNKYYIDSGMKVNMNKNYNKPNTIIINNNIHINTFIDKNNLNVNRKDTYKEKANKNLFLYNHTSDKKTNEFYDERTNNKFRNIRNKQKYESNLNNSKNKINKSSIAFSNKLD